MAIRYHGSTTPSRKEDIMNNEKWASKQRGEVDIYNKEDVSLTKEFLEHLCSLVEPNYNINYLDSDKILLKTDNNTIAL